MRTAIFQFRCKLRFPPLSLHHLFESLSLQVVFQKNGDASRISPPGVPVFTVFFRLWRASGESEPCRIPQGRHAHGRDLCIFPFCG